jgi:hypothetical protein
MTIQPCFVPVLVLDFITLRTLCPAHSLANSRAAARVFCLLHVCRLSIVGLKTFAPGVPMKVVGKRPDGSTYDIPVNHTFNDNQINWFKHGSALNAMAAHFASKRA